MSHLSNSMKLVWDKPEVGMFRARCWEAGPGDGIRVLGLRDFGFVAYAINDGYLAWVGPENASENCQEFNEFDEACKYIREQYKSK